MNGYIQVCSLSFNNNLKFGIILFDPTKFSILHWSKLFERVGVIRKVCQQRNRVVEIVLSHCLGLQESKGTCDVAKGGDNFDDIIFLYFYHLFEDDMKLFYHYGMVYVESKK